jgi:hypothetical protein
MEPAVGLSSWLILYGCYRPQAAAHSFARLERLHHPVVGDRELSYEGLDLPADPGWHMYTFTAAPGSPSDDRLRLLASWAVTLEQENTASPSASADAFPNA